MNQKKTYRALSQALFVLVTHTSEKEAHLDRAERIFASIVATGGINASAVKMAVPEGNQHQVSGMRCENDVPMVPDGSSQGEDDQGDGCEGLERKTVRKSSGKRKYLLISYDKDDHESVEEQFPGPHDPLYQPERVTANGCRRGSGCSRGRGRGRDNTHRHNGKSK